MRSQLGGHAPVGEAIALDSAPSGDVAHDLVVDNVLGSMAGSESEILVLAEDTGLAEIKVVDGEEGIVSVSGSLNDGGIAVATEDTNLPLALKRSRELQDRVSAARQNQEIALQASLCRFNAFAVLDESTPGDGHCLFHALRIGGMFDEIDFGNSVTIADLRKMALHEATLHELTVAAAGCGDAGVTVEEYVAGMQASEWGDNLMIAKLASLFQRSITVIKTSGADGSPLVLCDRIACLCLSSLWFLLASLGIVRSQCV